MKNIDLSNYGFIYKKPQRILEKRGVLDSDSLDLHRQIANKFNLRYCDYGVSLCLYEQFSETPSFYAYLLVKQKSVLNDEDVHQHQSIYEMENKDLWDDLSRMEGRQIKDFVYFNETRQKAFSRFAEFIRTCMLLDNNIYYWVKFDTTDNIPLIQEKLKGYCINTCNMPNEADILILSPALSPKELD